MVLPALAMPINNVFPMAEIQRCIVHPIRYSIKFFLTRISKTFMADLKEVYMAPTEEIDNFNRQLPQGNKKSYYISNR